MTTVKLHNTSEALKDIKIRYPGRVMTTHEPLDTSEKSHWYHRAVGKGAKLEDFTSVAVDASFCGDPPRFIIGKVVYTAHEFLGPLEDHMEEFSGIQKETAAKFLS